MKITYAPYHLDEHLPSLDVPLPPRATVEQLTVDLPEADVWSRLAALYTSVAEATETTARSGSVATVVSGDCTVTIGMMAGLRRAGIDPAVVWVDAHGDLQSFETTVSGYLGGMAFRLLLGYRSQDLIDRLGLRSLSPERAMLVDGRDLESAEIAYVAASGLRHVGLAGLTESVLPDGPLLVNIDLDTVDAGELPGIRYPAADGPTAAALRRAMAPILGSGRAAGLNIACTWDPGHADPDGNRGRLVSELLADLNPAGPTPDGGTH